MNQALYSVSSGLLRPIRFMSRLSTFPVSPHLDDLLPVPVPIGKVRAAGRLFPPHQLQRPPLVLQGPDLRADLPVRATRPLLQDERTDVELLRLAPGNADGGRPATVVAVDRGGPRAGDASDLKMLTADARAGPVSRGRPLHDERVAACTRRVGIHNESLDRFFSGPFPDRGRRFDGMYSSSCGGSARSDLQILSPGYQHVATLTLLGPPSDLPAQADHFVDLLLGEGLLDDDHIFLQTEEEGQSAHASERGNHG